MQWSRTYRRTQRGAQHSKYNAISRLFSFSHFQHVPTDVCLLLCRSTLFLYRMSQKNEPVNLSLTLLKQITFLNSYFWLQFIHHYLTKYQPAFIELSFLLFNKYANFCQMYSLCKTSIYRPTFIQVLFSKDASFCHPYSVAYTRNSKYQILTSHQQCQICRNACVEEYTQCTRFRRFGVD